MREIELRLDRHGEPDGELRADRVAWIVTAVDDLMLRLTREAASAAGLGRPGLVIERLAEVRLAGISGKGTRLLFRVGDPDALDIDPLSDQSDSMLRALLVGIADNSRPEFVTGAIAAATLRLVAALQRSAPLVEVSVGGRTPMRLFTARLDRTVWEPEDRDGRPTTLTGRLEAVDLRNAHFRIVDDEGRRIELVGVENSDEAAAFVNSLIIAEGALTPATVTARARMESVTVTPVPDPTGSLPTPTPTPTPGMGADALRATTGWLGPGATRETDPTYDTGPHLIAFDDEARSRGDAQA